MEIVYLIILFCIVMNAWSLYQMMTAGKFLVPSSHFSLSSNTRQTNLKPKCCFSPVDLGGYIREYVLVPQKDELVHVIHPITPGFDGLGSPCSAVVAWPEQTLWTSLVHFLCTALPVTGLLYSLTASLLCLLKEQSLPEPMAIFF